MGDVRDDLLAAAEKWKDRAKRAHAALIRDRFSEAAGYEAAYRLGRKTMREEAARICLDETWGAHPHRLGRKIQRLKLGAIPAASQPERIPEHHRPATTPTEDGND